MVWFIRIIVLLFFVVLIELLVMFIEVDIFIILFDKEKMWREWEIIFYGNKWFRILKLYVYVSRKLVFIKKYVFCFKCICVI